MTKKLYYLLLTITFGIISIQTIVNIIFQEQILTIVFNKAFIKLLLILFICIVEISLIKRTLQKVIGYILWFLVLIGILFKIQHWPWGNEIFELAGLFTLVNLVIAAITDKNKDFFHFLLYAFILLRFIIFLTPTNEFLWWIDVIICVVITIVGIGKIISLKRSKT